MAIPTSRKPNNCDTGENCYCDCPDKQWLAVFNRLLADKGKERRHIGLINRLLDVNWCAWNSHLINVRYETLRISCAGSNSLIEPPKAFEHDLCPGLIDGALNGLDLGVEFKLSVRQRQGIVDRIYPMEHANACVNHRTALKEEVSGALRI